MPSFTQVLTAITESWDSRRGEVEAAAKDIASRLADRGQLAELSDSGPPSDEDLAAAVVGLGRSFDPVHGGFGGAPKFPPSMVLEFLLRHHARTGDGAALDMVARTCEAMARGGMYDQLGGGFARYSVDAALGGAALREDVVRQRLAAARLRPLVAGDRRPAGRAGGRRDGRVPAARPAYAEGGFASALDADTEGVEGLTYVWTPAQLVEVLGDGRRRLGRRAPRGHRARHVRARVIGAPAADRPGRPARRSAIRAACSPTRRGRARSRNATTRSWPPGTAWRSPPSPRPGAVFERPEWVEAAEAAADLLVAVHLGADGRADRVVRVSKDGTAGRHAGVLEDQADVAEGLLALYAVTGRTEWLTLAGVLLDAVLAHFGDGAGSFYDTADDAERLLRRPQDPSDNATPSGPSAAAGALLTYAAYTGSSRHREAAEAALGVYGTLARQHPRFAGWGLAVAEAALDGPREVAVVGTPGDERPGAAAAGGAASDQRRGWWSPLGPLDPDEAAAVPLLADRPLVGGQAAAYVCRGFVCDLPTTDPEALAGALGARASLS